MDIVISGGDAPNVVSTKVVALYEPASGRIVHLHSVCLHEGAEEVTDAAAIACAQRHASRLGHDPDQLAVALSRNARHGSIPHRIDPGSGRFVALETIDGSQPKS